MKERKQDPKKRIYNFDEVSFGLDHEQALNEAKRCLNCLKPMCVQGCPTKQKIPQFIQKIVQGNLEEALELIIQDNPFPITTGKICPAFCEKRCVLGIKGSPIQIRLLKRYVTENTDYTKIKIHRKDLTGKKILIIGSGPSGLSAAFFLSKEGHDVTVYEKMKIAGGMLYYSIPNYRLPKDALSKELQLIKNAGVNIITSHEVKDFKDIINKFDAIYIATGAWKTKKMNIIGEEKAINAVQFLFDVNSGKDVKVGEKVIIVGGGDVAIDASRTALRLGAKDVEIVYRRSKEEMPASPNEIEEAENEGVKVTFLVNPIEITNKKIKLVKMELGDLDESGRRKPIPLENSEFYIEADNIILALGQAVEPIEGIDTTTQGTIQVDQNYKTNISNVWAGGDSVTGPATVISALSVGKRVANEINKELSQ
ncbi:MAG: NAD(P)-dependent oxidoreductase [Nanoarchaeota archaeon]|nr:NAD(P)-dependent oxidoreductase [Nanoarchaeota archaeon]